MRDGLQFEPTAGQHDNTVKSGLVRLNNVSSRSVGVVENNSLAAQVRNHVIFKVVADIQARIAPKKRCNVRR